MAEAELPYIFPSLVIPYDDFIWMEPRVVASSYLGGGACYHWGGSECFLGASACCRELLQAEVGDRDPLPSSGRTKHARRNSCGNSVPTSAKMLQRKSISTNRMPPPSSTLLIVCAKLPGVGQDTERRAAQGPSCQPSRPWSHGVAAGEGLDPTRKRGALPAAGLAHARMVDRPTSLNGLQLNTLKPVVVPIAKQLWSWLNPT